MGNLGYQGRTVFVVSLENGVPQVRVDLRVLLGNQESLGLRDLLASLELLEKQAHLDQVVYPEKLDDQENLEKRDHQDPLGLEESQESLARLDYLDFQENADFLGYLECLA